MAQKHRLNVDMTPEGKRQLDSLQKNLRVPAMIDVIRKAFAILELILDHQKAGGKVVLEHKDGSRETLKIV